MGGEIKNPGSNIPKSMFISVACIFILYLSLNISIASVIPWQDAVKHEHIVSSFIEIVSGHKASLFATALILIVAISSLFAATLGYSRVPYAAAADGAFFRIFARLHPTKNFPYLSLLFIGSLGFIFSLMFRLGDVIDAILAMRILVQFIAQAIGVVLLRKRFGTSKLPFKMWLYPMPVIISILIWLYVFVSTGWFALWGSLIAGIGVLVYYIKSAMENKVQKPVPVD